LILLSLCYVGHCPIWVCSWETTNLLMIKFGNVKKIGPFGFLFQTVWFWRFSEQEQRRAKFEDLKIQGVLRYEKNTKRYQGAMMKEIQAKSRSWSQKIGLLARLKKLDHLVSYSELSGFDDFQNRNRDELNSKIWRSKVFWGMKKY
jgi:hypothetical protein